MNTHKTLAIVIASAIIALAGAAFAVDGIGRDTDRSEACRKARADGAAQTKGGRGRFSECECTKNASTQIFECKVTKQ
jgi:hypothetical protein